VNEAIYKTSRVTALCTQIVAKQTLPLALAKAVKVCNFRDWELDDIPPWAARLFANKYIAGMLHMENIRQIKFTSSFVDTKHWNAIATLESLEEPPFNWCTFLQGPADVEPEKRVTVKVSHLRVVECDGLRQLIAAMDVRYLRTLAMDNKFFNQIDWLLPDYSHTTPRLLPAPGSGTGLVPACLPSSCAGKHPSLLRH
jgi:hypothetical protein